MNSETPQQKKNVTEARPPFRVLLTGGGTGGHIVPGVAVGNALLQRSPAPSLCYVTTRRKTEANFEYPKEAELIPMAAGRIDKRLWRLPISVYNYFKAIAQAKRIFATFRPDLVVGLGGYGSIGPLAYAKRSRVPYILLEQNVLPGKVTRRFASDAQCVAISWEETRKYLPPDAAIRCTGNPILPIPLRDEIDVREYGLDPERRTILITGGSQGAHAINQTILSLIPRLNVTPGIQLVHAVGDYTWAAAEEAYKAALFPAHVRRFIRNIRDFMTVSDIAICRAGATTLAELCAAGLPSILIPYPYAAERHQHANAQILTDAGAAVMIDQSELSPDRLFQEVSKLLNAPDELERMRKAALSLARPAAASHVAEIIWTLCTASSKPPKKE